MPVKSGRWGREGLAPKWLPEAAEPTAPAAFGVAPVRLAVAGLRQEAGRCRTDGACPRRARALMTERKIYRAVGP